MARLPHEIWKTMNKQDLRQFAMAVFFLFAAIGPLTLLMDEPIIPASWLQLILMTVLCGLFSWTLVMSFNRPFRLFFTISAYVIIIFSLAILKPEFLRSDVPEISVRADIPFSLSSEQLSDIVIKRISFGMMAVLCISTGYALFVRSFGKESRRRAEIEADVKLAQTIHESLLPKSGLTLPWCDAAGLSIPAAQIGGDFYDLLSVQDDKILAVVADASGHGTGAGILSAMTKSGIIQELRHTQSPSDVLRNVNATIHGVTKKNMFVTCALGLFNRTTMTATLVTAGHPPILRFDPVSGTVEEFRNHNLALGISPASTFASTTIPIRSGECFCLITDGLTETSNTAQEQFGMERIKAMLHRLPGKSAEESGIALMGAVMQFAGGMELNDDITALIIRIV